MEGELDMVIEANNHEARKTEIHGLVIAYDSRARKDEAILSMGRRIEKLQKDKEDWVRLAGQRALRLVDVKHDLSKAEAELGRLRKGLDAYEGMDHAVDYYREQCCKAEAENKQLKAEVERLRQALLKDHLPCCGIFDDGVCDCSYEDGE